VDDDRAVSVSRSASVTNVAAVNYAWTHTGYSNNIPHMLI
jgi:hypothetical protein